MLTAHLGKGCSWSCTGKGALSDTVVRILGREWRVGAGWACSSAA